MRFAFLLCILPLALSVPIAPSSGYTVKATRVSNTPLISRETGSTTFDYAYNAAASRLSDDKILLFIRSQNNASDGSEATKYATTPSVISLAEIQIHGKDEKVTPSVVTKKDISFAPTSAADDFGTEDPRVLKINDTFYMFYSAVSSKPNVVSHLSLATTKNPFDDKAWTRHGPLFGDKWSKSGSLVLAPSPPHTLLWGDSADVCGLHVAKTDDLLHYNETDRIVLACRPDHFDADLLEGGPPPLPLSNGNYFYVYNSARKTPPSSKPGYALEYNIGWAIFDARCDTIIARSDEPLLSPDEGWEREGLTPNVVFCEGMWKVEGEGEDVFQIVYGAADTVLGLATVKVTVPAK